MNRDIAISGIVRNQGNVVQTTSKKFVLGVLALVIFGSGLVVGVVVQTQVSASGSALNKMALGDNHGCGVREGFVYCWGQGVVNQIGDNTVNNSSTPKFVPSWAGFTNSGVTDIAAGRWGTCVVKQGGLFCWGRQDKGQFGNNDASDARVTRPTRMAAGSGEVLEGKTVTAVSANVLHTCVIASGQMYCMGENLRGQLGDGTTTQRLVPTLVATVNGGFRNGTDPNIGPVTHISVGYQHTCAVEGGIAYCWGWNDHGRNGNLSFNSGAMVSEPTPGRVTSTGAMANNGNVTSISAGLEHTCAIESGKVYCWGSRLQGRLTGSTSGNSVTPVLAADNGTSFVNSGVSQVAAGTDTTCALKGGVVSCWGRQQHGQLGNGLITDAVVSTPTPIQAGAMATNTAIDHIEQSNAVSSGNLGWACAARQGRFFCWGHQQFNNVLGNNSVSGATVTSSGVPVETSRTWPVISAVSPASGPLGGNSQITVTGSNFTAGATVTVGGAACASVSVVSSTSITCTTPVGTAGTQNIVVTNADTQTGTGSGLYTFVAAPTVTSVSPSSGPTVGGTAITVTGSNFTAGATVTVGGAACASVSVVSSTSITCTTPVGTAGASSVVVTSGGQSNANNALFTYSSPVTTTTVPPSSMNVSQIEASPTTAEAPLLVTSSNQSALTATPGKAAALVNGVAVTPQIVTASNSAAAQADPAARTPEQVRELQQAASAIETRLDTIAGGDSGVSVVRTETGAVMTGIFSGTRVPVEDVVVVNAADTATLFAARDVRGNIVEVKPGAVLEVAPNGDVAVQAFGLRSGERVELVVMSTPTLLGNYTVDAKGTIKTTAKLPTTIGTGNHSLVVASPSVKASLGLKLVKSNATLPITGSTYSTDLTNWAVAVLLSGVYVMMATRSRRRSYHL